MAITDDMRRRAVEAAANLTPAGRVAQAVAPGAVAAAEGAQPAQPTPAQPASSQPAPSSGGGSSIESGSGMAYVVLAIFIGFHIYDWLRGYINDWAIMVTIIVTVSLVMAFLSPIGTSYLSMAWFKVLIWYLVLWLIQFGVPRIAKFAFEFFPGIAWRSIFGVFLIFPLGALLFAMRTPGVDEHIRRFSAGYVGFWLLIFVITLFVTVQWPAADFQQADTIAGGKEFFDMLFDRLADFWENLGQTKNNFIASINGTFSPQYYTGRVENNKGRTELGVQIEDLQPIDPYFPKEAPVIISGYISAKTFLDESMMVEPSCRIDERTGNYPAGKVDPQQVEIYYGADELFECRFPAEFEDGYSYNVEASATFPFETWADITYTFVTEEKVREFAQRKQNIHSVLKIPQVPEAIYTAGPVMLGLGGANRMPIRVNRQAPFFENTYLGFTIQSTWPDGELNRVEELVLLVPRGFRLEKCDRADLPGSEVIGPSSDPNEPTYDRYIFRNTFEKDMPYTSVRCELHLEDGDALQDLWTGADVAYRTFIAMARYRYTVKEKTVFRVSE